MNKLANTSTELEYKLEVSLLIYLSMPNRSGRPEEKEGGLKCLEGLEASEA